MRKIWIWCVPLVLTAGEDFISRFEYGQMLYKNPRGIACEACHGTRGEGAVITRYRDDDNRTHTLKAPPIYRLSFARFYRPFTPEGHKRKDIMPRYHLTEEEIRTIYDYLRQLHRNEKGASR